VDRVVEIRLLDLTTQVELAAFDDAEFYDAMQRARDRGTFAASMVVTNVLDCVTGAAGIVSAALVVAVLQPVLLVLLLLAELPEGWAAVRAARIGYITNFALADSRRRKWILTDLMAERHTAAEMRSFTLRHFMLARVARLAAYARDAQMKAAGRQALTRVTAQAASGVATAGVYVALGILLAVGALPLAVAGTAVLAIRSAQASLNTLLYAVNQCYEEGLYFSDYLAFCADAARRIPPRGATPAPAGFDLITADAITFAYPGAATSALREVTVEIRRGEVIALVGENGSGKTTLAKILAGLYRPGRGAVRWDGTDVAAVDPESLREQIAVIAQDHANWPLTVRPQHRHGPRRGPGRAGPGGGGLRGGHGDRRLPHGYRRRHLAWQIENRPNMMSPIATRTRSHGPSGVDASVRSAESIPLACCGLAWTAATTRKMPAVTNTAPRAMPPNLPSHTTTRLIRAPAWPNSRSLRNFSCQAA
jgi:ATP-binding cassette, subfamily B, bacterial